MFFRTLLCALLWSGFAQAQTYYQMTWGITQGTSPYTFAVNLGGTWQSMGKISSAGAWALPYEVLDDITFYKIPGDTSDCEALGRAIAGNVGGIVQLPGRVVTLGTVSVPCNLVIEDQVTIQGTGWQETTLTGTVLDMPNPSGSTFTIQNTDSRGITFRNLALRQTHPALGPGWTPTNYPVTFNIVSSLGEVQFDNILAWNINKLISSYESGRLKVNNLQGQIFTTGITVDAGYDTVRIYDVHFWPYWTNDANVLTYQQANLEGIVFKRVDTPLLDNYVLIYALRGLSLTSSAAGVTTKLQAGKISCDFTKFCVDVTGDAVVAHISELMGQSEDVNNPGVPLAGARTVKMSSNAAYLDVSLMEAERYALEAIELTSAAVGSQFIVGSLRCNLVNVNNVAGTGCAKDAGTVDTLRFLSDPYIVNSNGAGAVSTGTTGVGTIQKNMIASRASWPFVAEVATGGTVVYTTLGTDVNRRVVLDAVGNQRSALSANGKLIISADDFNGNGDTTMLCRTAIGALDCLLESSSSNAQLTFQAKGTSPIIMNNPLKPPTYTIGGTLPTCDATILGAVAIVSNGTAYGVGTYGAAVGATGIVSRQVLCTNTAGATTYDWAYN